MAEPQLQRLGLVMEPEPGNPLEAEGVLNPAAARGPDGQLYLFPRLVARGNYSRIGIARVRFNEAGDPVGVERLGIALEPEADYERRSDGGGGCEDPRITFVEPLQRYVMTYTALSPNGPRIALAISEDLLHWRRLGLATFSPYHGIEFEGVDNKDASMFPVAVPDPSGQPSMAILHRPLFPGTRPEETRASLGIPRAWISIGRASGFLTARWRRRGREPHHLGQFTSHHRLASPVAPWERLKIGGGTPPVLTRHGWLVIYHGVCELTEPSVGNAHHALLRRSAGALRGASTFYSLSFAGTGADTGAAARTPGTVANVVFPTGIDRRDDLGSPDRFDVYYGMADNRIGAARLDVPDFLPTGALADPPGAKV